MAPALSVFPRVCHCLQGPLMYSDYCSGVHDAALESLVLDTAHAVLGLPDLTKEQVLVHLRYTPWGHCCIAAPYARSQQAEKIVLGPDAQFPKR